VPIYERDLSRNITEALRRIHYRRGTAGAHGHDETGINPGPASLSSSTGSFVMNRVSVVVASVMFMLGAIVGNSMSSATSVPTVKNQSTFDLQRNAPANLPVQQYDAV
jgi:hypothetical protein